MAAGLIGQMLTYKSGNLLEPGAPWAIDNGRVIIVDGKPVTDPDWSAERWSAHLERYKDTPGCLFAAVPDTVGDAAETDVLWRRWAPAVARRGYTPAYVAQNGCTRIPAGALVVFMGGDDEFKDGPEAARIARLAKASGRRVHVGRVNTRTRLRHAAIHLDADTVDGTGLAFGPDRNLPQLLNWLYPDQPSLWGVA